MSIVLQEIDYAGVRRSIIYRNPPLVDDDGYEVFSEDDTERIENAVQSAAELNPYTNIRIERKWIEVKHAAYHVLRC